MHIAVSFLQLFFLLYSIQECDYFYKIGTINIFYILVT